MSQTHQIGGAGQPDDGWASVGLRNLDLPCGLKFLPEFPLTRAVLLPAFEQASRVRGMFGYFTSTVLQQLSHGLASYLSRPTDPIRLIVSPELAEEDRLAIYEARTDPAAVLSRRFGEVLLDRDATGSALARHGAECLAWMLAEGRLALRLGFSSKQARLYHPKTWLFEDATGLVAVHGSSNATAPGLGGNTEQVHIALSWLEGHAQDVQDLEDEFEAQWRNESRNARTFEIDTRVAQLLRDAAPENAPSAGDYITALQLDISHGLYDEPGNAGNLASENGAKTTMRFEIPEALEWQTGPYSHQGAAVSSWETAGCRGVLQMATGAGKTITALIAAHRLLKATTPPLLIVISAPTAPLVSQWADEVRDFGLTPILPTAESSRVRKLAAVDGALRDLKFGIAPVHCLVVTTHLLNDPDFRRMVEQSKLPSLLVGDEVHALGSAAFTEEPPEFFRYRLGLSATPIRQYDDAGTAALFEFFGDIVYEFGLDKAIGSCLVEYDYYVHTVELTDDELDRFAELTQKIIKRMNPNSQDPEDDEALQRLLIRRREILESASGKVPALMKTLTSLGVRGLRHTLIYATSKNPQQLIDINLALQDVGVTYHQVTQDESGDPRLLARILQAFRSGIIQVLTAKRVLDEGVNIPEVSQAFLVASSGVEREWVQRRGRVLRQCRATGKSQATIHDFIVVPPSHYAVDPMGRKLVRRELERVQAFAELARNAGEPGSGSLVASDLIINFFGEN